MLSSAKSGLLLWYNSVLPSVLPFLIISNVLIEIGAVTKLGRTLEPIMRPLFNVPGCGAFAWLMGGVSGYPVGARITADFREKGLITKDEAQRLISFSNNAGPLFMLGAVGTAILGSPAAGYFILATNYLSAVVVGLIFRFYKSESQSPSQKRVSSPTRGHRAVTRPLGVVLGDSVARAIEILIQIGGFILLFSALIKILEISQFVNLLACILSPAFSAFSADKSLIAPFVGGIFEMTNGIKMAGETGTVFSQKVLLSGVLVSFGGLSIYAQTVSFIAKTDISASICLVSKILHAIFHFMIMLLLYPLFKDFLH